MAKSHPPLPSEFFSLVFSQLREGVCILDSRGKVLLSNQAAEEMLGWKNGQLPGKEIVEFIYDTEKIPSPLIEAIRTGGAITGHETFFKGRDETIFPVEYTISPIKKGTQSICSVITFQHMPEPECFKNFPPQILREQAPQTKIASLRRVFDSNMFGVIYGDFQGGIFSVS